VSCRCDKKSQVSPRIVEEMPISGLFRFEQVYHAQWATPMLARLPRMAGRPIAIENRPGLVDRRGPVHAGAFLRSRRILLNCSREEFTRVFVHELFHFVWLRLGNPRRWSYEDLIDTELVAHARGELGWSAEWRKAALGGAHRRNRGRTWREYCCESFCDSAAWLYSGCRAHEEFTLAPRFRARRRDWFTYIAGAGPLSI
jgi:hypothetical protein